MLLLFYLLQLLQYGLRYIGIQFVQIQPSLHLWGVIKSIITLQANLNVWKSTKVFGIAQS